MFSSLIGSQFSLDILEQGDAALDPNGTRIHDQRVVTGIVTVSDATKGLATGKAANAEMDVLVVTLERFDLALAQDVGLVIC